MKHTSKEWQEIYPCPKVIDPDGWDRKNYDYSWNEELISEKEYHERVAKSTVRFHGSAKEFTERLSRLLGNES